MPAMITATPLTLPIGIRRAIQIVSTLLTQLAGNSFCRRLHRLIVVTSSQQFIPNRLTR